MAGVDLGLDARSMPVDLDAEKAVLGTLLAWPERLDDVQDLRPGHFYRGAHRAIFAALLGLHEARVTPDALTVRDALSRAGKLEDVGGLAYLASLTDGIPRSTNLLGYVGIVRDKALRRDLVYLAQRMGAGALGDAEDVADLIQGCARDLFALEQGDRDGGWQPMRDLVVRVMEHVERWHASKQAVTGLATGFVDIDDMLGGLQAGHLVVLAARPSMGKSALMMAIAEHVATSGGSVGVFSLEMSADELATRELSGASGVDGYRLRRGYLGERDWGRLASAIGTLSASRLWIDETPNLTIFDMRARARRLKSEHGLSLLVIDYLQLIDSTEDRRNENRVQAISQMTRGLKQLAKELWVPIVLLSQLSRAVESRSDKRPMLSDLRESGAIEQDSDEVLFIYRAAWYDRGADPNEAEIIVAKQRNGPTGTVKLHFVPELTRFFNAAPGAAVQGDLGVRG